MLKDDDGFFVLTVRQGEDGCRLDVLLSKRFACSRTSLRNKLETKVVNADGVAMKWSRRLYRGQLIRIEALQRPEPDVQVSYRIIFQDQWIVAVDKGPGAPVHPSRSYRTKTILTALRAELDDPGLCPAHRLDRETSGVLVFSRCSKVASCLQKQFSSRSIQKTYLAIVRGVPSSPTQSLDQSLGKDPEFPIDCRMRVDPDGKPALTVLKVLHSYEDKALVQAMPRTGRMHQIRLHLANSSHPILGDKLYQFDGQAYLAMIGNELSPLWYERLGHHRLALHAAKLKMLHPVTGEQLELRAGLPHDMEALLTP